MLKFSSVPVKRLSFPRKRSPFEKSSQSRPDLGPDPPQCGGTGVFNNISFRASRTHHYVELQSACNSILRARRLLLLLLLL